MPDDNPPIGLSAEALEALFEIFKSERKEFLKGALEVDTTGEHDTLADAADAHAMKVCGAIVEHLRHTLPAAPMPTLY